AAPGQLARDGREGLAFPGVGRHAPVVGPRVCIDPVTHGRPLGEQVGAGDDRLARFGGLDHQGRGGGPGSGVETQSLAVDAGVDDDARPDPGHVVVVRWLDGRRDGLLRYHARARAFVGGAGVPLAHVDDGGKGPLVNLGAGDGRLGNTWLRAGKGRRQRDDQVAERPQSEGASQGRACVVVVHGHLPRAYGWSTWRTVHEHGAATACRPATNFDGRTRFPLRSFPDLSTKSASRDVRTWTLRRKVPGQALTNQYNGSAFPAPGKSAVAFCYVVQAQDRMTGIRRGAAEPNEPRPSDADPSENRGWCPARTEAGAAARPVRVAAHVAAVHGPHGERPEHLFLLDQPDPAGGPAAAHRAGAAGGPGAGAGRAGR